MRTLEWFLHWYFENRILWGYNRRESFKKATALTKTMAKEYKT